MLARSPQEPIGGDRQLDGAGDDLSSSLDERLAHEHSATHGVGGMASDPDEPICSPDPDGRVHPRLADRAVIPSAGQDESSADDMQSEEDLVGPAGERVSREPGEGKRTRRLLPPSQPR